MGGFSFIRNVGAYLAAMIALKQVTITAGGAGDNVAQNGVAVATDGYESGKLVVAIEGALAAAESVTVTAKVQTSADGSTGWADLKDVFGAALSASTTIEDGADETGVLTLDFDLVRSHGMGYVRAVVTADLSAGATDTAKLSAVFVLGGAESLS